MGDGNRIHHGAVIGGLPQDLKYYGEDTFLTVGNDNTFRENVTVNRGTGNGGYKTEVGDGNLLLNVTNSDPEAADDLQTYVAYGSGGGDDLYFNARADLTGQANVADADTRFAREKLDDALDKLTSYPEWFTPHPRIERFVLEKQRRVLRKEIAALRRLANRLAEPLLEL